MLPKNIIDILDRMNDSILLYNKNGYLEFTNKSYDELLGINREYAKKQVWGKHISKATIHPEPVLEVLETGIPKYNHRFLVEKAGAEFVVQMLPIKNNHNKVDGIIIIGQINSVHELQSTIVNQRKKSKMERKEFVKFRPKELLPESFQKMVGNNISFVRTLVKASTVSDTDITILITGESGTGKDILAQAIHAASARASNNFEVLNCAAIPDHLIESELFGYASGAFTGASSRGKPGKMSLANQGTLVLDEIGDMSLPMQSKLLRAIQYKRFEPVGATKTLETDIRIIACTNKELLSLVEKGIFREDLYYRINVFPIYILPLRERMDDLCALCEHFINMLAEKYRCSIPKLSPDVQMLFQRHHWPGNIRELINVLEHAVAISVGESSGIIDYVHLPSYLVHSDKMNSFAHKNEKMPKMMIKSKKYNEKNLKSILKDVEEEVFMKVVLHSKNKTEAIEQLGISRRTFYQKLKEYNLY